MMEVTDGITMKSLISIISTDGDRKYSPSFKSVSLLLLVLGNTLLHSNQCLCCCLFFKF